MVSSEQKTTMADQLGWSLGTEGFPDLATDFLNSNTFDNNNLEDIDGKSFNYSVILVLFALFS